MTVIDQKHRQGWSEARTCDYLVAQFGEEVLAAPPKHGFDLLAWLVPAAVLLGGAALAAGCWRWPGRAAAAAGDAAAPPATPTPRWTPASTRELAREEA